jgi:hypothetical protein
MKEILFTIVVLLAVACSKEEPVKTADDLFDIYYRKYDTDGDGVLSEQEAEAVTVLRLYDIKSLGGMEMFINLEELSVVGGNDNRISLIDISKNTKLKEFSIEQVNLSSLDISRNVELIRLSCIETNLSSLDISNNSKLRYINIRDNHLSNNALRDILNALPVVNDEEIDHTDGTGYGLAYFNVDQNGQTSFPFYRYEDDYGILVCHEIYDIIALKNWVWRNVR